MKAKKIPYYFLLFLMTIGASLILGFLSFGGMFALWPILPLAFGAFALSVAYEGEIYLQNIKGALNKLFFKREYLKHHLANEFLLNNFPNENNLKSPSCPKFFKDYKAQLKLLHKFGHKTLDSDSLQRKKYIEKTLTDMEKWFALQLFNAQEETSKYETTMEYEEELQTWLKGKNQHETIELLKNRKTIFHVVQAFSLLSGLFMALGTTYLLVGEFASIPILATIPFGTLPFIILPMALIAGAAYGFLTYNAITDMINNDTLRKWYHKIRDDFKDGITFRNVLMAATTVILLGLAVALTICTAGTWWTVAKNAQPLFTWMSKMPSFIMGIINPIITGISALIFNVQNTSETYEIIDDSLKTEGNVFQKIKQDIIDAYNDLRARENWFQILNPARILLTLTLTPLRILLFLGHLISIGVTSDRVPGIPEFASAIFGIISEGFEDMHYFIDHAHQHSHGHGDEHTKEMLKERLGAGHSHNHDVDLPTKLLKALFLPLYLLAAGWACLASELNATDSKTNKEVLSFADAWTQQTGQKKEKSVQVASLNVTSADWKIEHAVYRIERHKEKHLNGAIINRDIAQIKARDLTDLQNEIRAKSELTPINTKIKTAAKEESYNIHRFFDNGNTQTKDMLIELPERIGLTAASAASAA